jgi:hypothetical protein
MMLKVCGIQTARGMSSAESPKIFEFCAFRESYFLEENEMRTGRLWAIMLISGVLCGQGFADVVEPGPGPIIIFRAGDIYVRETIDIKGGAELGMIDSNFPLCLQTNSSEADAIKLGAGVVVPGDVFIPSISDQNSIVKVHPSAVIEGDICAANDIIDLPPVVVPDSLLNQWSYGGSMAGDNVTISGDGWYDAISIGRGGILTITANSRIYVAGDMYVARDTQVVVTSGSTLTLYLGGDLLLDTGSAIASEDGDPDSVHIFGTDYCQSIELRRNSALWGYIYAPATHFLNAGSVVGRFTGRSATITSSGSFYCPTIDMPAIP